MKKIAVYVLMIILLMTVMPQHSFPSDVVVHADTPGNTPAIVIDNANWAATDALGRVLPTYEQTGGPKADKYVGIFYWLWHTNGSTRTPAKDATKTIYANPANPDWGTEHHNYYWGEPEAGYYRSDDPWVIRKHLIMFANAGIDFIYLDYTNDEYYVQELQTLFQQSASLRQMGIKTPSIVFFFNYNPEWKIRKVYNEIYSQSQYQDLWFYWNGKPLILSPKGTVTESNILNFFTWRQTWAFDTTVNDWLFLDQYKQDPSNLSLNGAPEQIIVSKGMGSPLYNGSEAHNKGSSAMNNQEAPLNQYYESPFTGTGRFMSEQMSRAAQVNPAIVMFTGWNELTAGTWPADSGMVNAGYSFMGKPLQANDKYMVDQFNREFNRDIEPMKGADTDNSYYQMLAFIRQYKGMKAPAASSAAKTISIDGSFSDWNDVTPVFNDPKGDTMNRNWLSLVNGNNHSYVNTTGRNDIVSSQVAYDQNNVYFKVKTDQNLTPHTDNNWMILYIDSDNSKTTGWEGYDYALNMQVNSSTQTTLSQYVNGTWQQASMINYRYSGNQMELSIPRSAIGQTSGVSLQFHWADNIQVKNSLAEFFVNGDSAPDRRFNYQYGTNNGTEGNALNRSSWTVTASASAAGNPPVSMIDNNGTTRWTTGATQTNGQWVTIDLGSTQSFHRIVLDSAGSPTDYPRGYQVFVSNNGTSWGNAIVNGTGSPSSTIITFPAQTARYIRIVQTESDSFYWWAIHEINVFGSPAGRGGSVIKAWNFDSHTEGWTGTHQISSFGWQSGGNVGGTITGNDPYILSPDNLNMDINQHRYIKIRMKNSTSGSNAQIYYTTTENPAMNEVKMRSFTVAPNSDYTVYTIDMTTAADWTGTLKQFRVDPIDGVGSGSFSIDYITIQNAP